MPFSFGGESHQLPHGAVIGLIGDSGSGVSELLRAAGGRFIGPGNTLDLSPAPLIALGYALDLRDAIERALAAAQIEPLRRSGSSVLVASFDSQMLASLADEIWWVHEGRVVRKGDAREILAAYTRHTAQRLRAVQPPVIQPALRRGDGRAELVALHAPGTVSSGDETEVRVQVRFHAPVDDPVVGIMIRTRVGMEVYGTNTELEHVRIGPQRAGDEATVVFRFQCALCPQSYTITAASHDPDGVWHDWMEDAVAFTVVDSRYTAGVANLRACVELSGSRERT